MKITNDQFILEAFKNAGPDERIWTLSKPIVSSRDWTGKMTSPGEPATFRADWNNYTSTSSYIRSGGLRRTKSTFHSIHFIVLDDADPEAVTAALAPSYCIETSPGSFQIGYFLDQPEPGMARVDELMRGLTEGLMCAADRSGNNSVRVIRTPVGCNDKRGGAQVELRLWEPERRYSLDQIAEAFKISIDVPEDDDLFNDSPEFKKELAVASENKLRENIRAILTGSDYHDPINSVAARMITKGLEPREAVTQMVTLMELGLEIVPDQCMDRWQLRYDDIERSVLGAVKKFQKKKLEDPKKSQYAEYKINSTHPRPTEWVLDGFLAWGITVIAGAPGTGKTSKLVALAALVAHLCDPDHPLKPTLRRRVIYITEDALQVERLLYGILKYGNTGVKPEELELWFKVRSAKRLEPEQVAAEVEMYSRTNTTEGLNGFQIKPLIVLDTSNASLDIEDENSNSEVGAFIGAIKGVLDSTPLWIIAHTAKALGRTDVKGLSARGAGAFEGDANATAYVFQEDEILDKRFLKLGKRRYESEFDELAFTSSTYTETVQTPWGKDQSVTIRLAHPEESDSASREIEKESAKESNDAEKASRKREAELELERQKQERTEELLEFLRTNPESSKAAIKVQWGRSPAKIRTFQECLSAGLIKTTKLGIYDVFSVADDTL